MEIRKPNYISREYKVSIKYLCARIGINMDKESIKTINVYDDDEDSKVDIVSIWTDEFIPDANTFR